MDPIGEKLLHVAKGELGYHEKSSGYTKYGEWYSKHVDKDAYFAKAPWCDMFLAWAANKAGVEKSVGDFASTPSHAAWFKKQGAWGHQAEPGAIAFFSWGGGKSIGDIDHVGIVESVDGGTLHTIEANHDNALLRATRDKSQVVGYGYPSKVKVATPKSDAKEATSTYSPKHAAAAPSVQDIGREHTTQHTAGTTSSPDGPPLAEQQAALTGLLAVVVFGTVALAIAKSRVKVPVPMPDVRLRKRGRHHRTPVELPVDVTPTDLDAAEAGTHAMPVVTATAAAQAEDREFWKRISDFEDDVELAFWNSLHSASSSPQYAVLRDS